MDDSLKPGLWNYSPFLCELPEFWRKLKVGILFDTGGQAYDIVSRTLLAYNSAPPAVTTPSGVGISFDGGADYLAIPSITLNNFSIVIGGAHNIGTAGNYCMFGADNYPSTPREAVVIKPYKQTVNVMTFEAYVNNTGPGAQNCNYWGSGSYSQLVVVRNGTNIKLYRDNSQESSQTVGSGSVSLQNIRLGAHYYSGTNNEHCACTYEYIYIFDEALTDAERKLILKKPFGLVTPSGF